MVLAECRVRWYGSDPYMVEQVLCSVLCCGWSIRCVVGIFYVENIVIIVVLCLTDSGDADAVVRGVIALESRPSHRR